MNATDNLHWYGMGSAGSQWWLLLHALLSVLVVQSEIEPALPVREGAWLVYCLYKVSTSGVCLALLGVPAATPASKAASYECCTGEYLTDGPFCVRMAMAARGGIR